LEFLLLIPTNYVIIKFWFRTCIYGAYIIYYILKVLSIIHISKDFAFLCEKLIICCIVFVVLIVVVGLIIYHYQQRCRRFWQICKSFQISNLLDDVIFDKLQINIKHMYTFTDTQLLTDITIDFPKNRTYAKLHVCWK
jgi:hypothetical protein